jgi:hypothetical protein
VTEDDGKSRVVNTFNREADAWQWVREQEHVREICTRIQKGAHDKRKVLCSPEQGLMSGKVGRWLGHKQRMSVLGLAVLPLWRPTCNAQTTERGVAMYRKHLEQSNFGKMR